MKPGDGMPAENILISGSRQMSRPMFDYTLRVIDRARERGFGVLVGDNPSGVDYTVITYCRSVHVPYRVFSLGDSRVSIPEINHVGVAVASYKMRDEYMVRQPSVKLVMCIWNGASSGTKHVYDYALRAGKQAHLINFGKFP